jgi:hypothetical protein
MAKAKQVEEAECPACKRVVAICPDPNRGPELRFIMHEKYAPEGTPLKKGDVRRSSGWVECRGSRKPITWRPRS